MQDFLCSADFGGYNSNPYVDRTSEAFTRPSHPSSLSLDRASFIDYPAGPSRTFQDSLEQRPLAVNPSAEMFNPYAPPLNITYEHYHGMDSKRARLEYPNDHRGPAYMLEGDQGREWEEARGPWDQGRSHQQSDYVDPFDVRREEFKYPSNQM